MFRDIIVEHNIALLLLETHCEGSFQCCRYNNFELQQPFLIFLENYRRWFDCDCRGCQAGGDVQKFGRFLNADCELVGAAGFKLRTACDIDLIQTIRKLWALNVIRQRLSNDRVHREVIQRDRENGQLIAIKRRVRVGKIEGDLNLAEINCCGDIVTDNYRAVDQLGVARVGVGV